MRIYLYDYNSSALQLKMQEEVIDWLIYNLKMVVIEPNLLLQKIKLQNMFIFVMNQLNYLFNKVSNIYQW